MKLIVSCLPALFVLATAGSAAAQQPDRTVRTADYTEQNVAGDQVVKFTGDELQGPSNGIYGNVIRRPPGILRQLLIRPRVNFVPELLRSVENL
jgi:hypothetical protein